MANTTRPRAVLYTRLSVARDASTSMAGQADDLAALAASEGWDVVATFADEGISGGKQRANAEEALAMLADGRADILAVYAYDRWSRQGVEVLGTLIRTLRERRERKDPARFVAMRESIDDDGSEENFDLRLSFAADLAKKERDRTRSRVAKSRQRLAAAGRFGGGVPPFGYRATDGERGRTLVIDEQEAAIVREVAARIIAKESLVHIAADLTSREIPRSRSPYRLAALRLADAAPGEVVKVKAGRDAEGRPITIDAVLNADGKPADIATGEVLPRGTWDQSRVRDLWRSQHLLGRLIANGASVGEIDGVAPFEPILTLTTHQTIEARFANVKRGHQSKRRASHLLSGFVYCAGCNGRMYPRESGGLYFGCSASARGAKCPLGHPRIKADGLERVVVDRFLSYVSTIPEVERIESASTDVAARLAEVRAAIAETSSRFADRTADRDEVLARLDTLQAEEERLESLPSDVTVEFCPTGRTIGEAWEYSEDLDARRQLLAGWIDYVSIEKARSRGHVIDTRRIRIEWQPGVENFERGEGNSAGPGRDPRRVVVEHLLATELKHR